jgi:glycosyltransferase involved in cell wall biosynthesis
VCGVAEYVILLSEVLQAHGVDARLIEFEDWGLRSAWKLRESLQDYDVVHIQYPSLGFGYQLGPQALALLRSSVVTIHEASQRKILRKLSTIPFVIRPKHVIFTTDIERQWVIKRAPWIAARSSVDPPPSSIRKFPEERSRTLNEVVYFGLILPTKGLEDVIELSRLIQSEGLSWKVRILGSPRPERMEYFQSLKAEAEGLPIIWDLNRSEEEVSERLASSAVAYLPFPDGASERRSTMKAALTQGVAVVTKLGAHTPEAMKSFLKFAETPREALSVIRALFQDTQERARLSKSAADYIQTWGTWEDVAERHLAVYRSVLRSDPLRGHDVKHGHV